MTMGAVWCPKSKKKEIVARIKEIKSKHKLNPSFEIKWNKVSPAKSDFYIDIVNYFFDDDDLHFRVLIVKDKMKLNHDAFQQNHDDFYYKMYFDMIKTILSPDYSYYIYLDIKDTKSQEKVDKLKHYLRSTHYDFKKQIIKRVQQVRSNEVQILQLTDLLTGAFSYLHRGLKENRGKLAIIEKIQIRSKYSLLQSTLYKEDKVNIFIWTPQNVK
jgi:hypothetical protein